AEAWAREEGAPEGGELPAPAAFRRMYGLLKEKEADVSRSQAGGADERERRGQKFRRRRHVVFAVSAVGLVCLFAICCLFLASWDGLKIRPTEKSGNGGALFSRPNGDGFENDRTAAADASGIQA